VYFAYVQVFKDSNKFTFDTFMLVHFLYIYTFLCHISVGYFHIAVSRMLLVYIFISCLTFHLWNTWCCYCFCCYFLSILLSTCSSVFWLHLAQRSFISCHLTVQKSRKISYWVIDLSFAFDSEWQRMSLCLLTQQWVSFICICTNCRQRGAEGCTVVWLHWDADGVCSDNAVIKCPCDW